MNKEYLDLLDYLPEAMLMESGKQYPLKINSDEEYIDLSYLVDVVTPSGKGRREHSCTLPRFIPKTEATFEVLGLLQAEMGKTGNGSLSFPNHEYKLINQVMRWFAETGLLQQDIWRWSIKINVNEPQDEEYRQEAEKKVIVHWLRRTKISNDKRYPKAVTYVNENHTKNKILQHRDYGTLVLEYKNKLFSDIIKYFVKKITYEKILIFDKLLIKGFMRGIIAGEGCVEFDRVIKKYRVHITAVNSFERKIYEQCLTKLSVRSTNYKNNKDLIISRKENLILLLNQKLMIISPAKYVKFCSMMQKYPSISEETGYFQKKGKNIHNRISEEKINKIVDMYNSGQTKTVDISQLLNISTIKINRVLRDHNLGRRLIKTPEPMKEQIASFVRNNLNMSNEQIAKHFSVHTSVITRICKKYNILKGNKSKCKISEEKTQQIISLYKENPIIKVFQVSKEVGVSSTVVRRVRKENNLQHLGFQHLIGNNNKKYRDVSSHKTSE